MTHLHESVKEKSKKRLSNPPRSPHNDNVHYPDTDCTCAAGPVYDYELREFSNGTLHVYRSCKCCYARSRSPVKRETIGLSKWRDLLIAHGREVHR